jgi:hypothetical protein
MVDGVKRNLPQMDADQNLFTAKGAKGRKGGLL